MRIAIVGGAGRMGQWLSRALVQQGQEVVLIDRDNARLQTAIIHLGVEGTTDPGMISTAGAFILAVPISSFEEVVQKLASSTSPGQIAIDVTSVKVMPVAVMHRYLPHCTVLGTHPIFGPGTKDLREQNVVLTPTSGREAALARQLGKTLKSHGANVSIMSPEKHDELMAVVLGLAHFIAVVTGDTLLSPGNLKELNEVSGPTFRALLAFVTTVLSEDPELYAAIQVNLAVLPGMEQAFADRACSWAEMVKNGDASSFAAKMFALRRMLAGQQGEPK